MKKIQYTALYAFMTLMLLIAAPWLGSTAKADNYLSIEPQTVRAGATASVPIYMTNSDKVVAIQFDITLPFNMPEGEGIRLTNRTVNHQVSTTPTQKTYKVVLSSMDNTAIKGNSGIVMRIPTAIEDNGSTSFPVTISNIVLADSKGNNIATQTSCQGTLTLSRDKVPNLTVPSVTVNTNPLTPGSKASYSYTVKNAGTGATMAGWTAKLYMESQTTGEKTYIGSQYYDKTIAADASVSQNFETVLPTAMRMDGSVRAVVEVVPGTDCGELIVDQNDNTGYSAYVTMNKLLTITPTSGNLGEERYWYSKGYSWRQYYHIDKVNVTLQRSGDCSVAETFSVSSKYKNLFEIAGIAIPTTVVIPAGSSSVTLAITAVDDQIVRASEDDVTFSSSTGYNSVSIHLTRQDDDTNPLSITASKAEITEGESLTITATRGGELLDALVIPLSCTASGRFQAMPTLKFAAGQSTCTVQVTSIDDDIAQLDKSVTFSASANYYQHAWTSVKLLDNDRPTITLKVSPSTISENAGSGATTAYITRKGLEDQALSIRITPSNDELYTGSSYVQIPAGVSRIEVPVGITDNSSVDGTRTRTLTAALYVAADGSLAPAGDRACSTASITVVDDESPYLTLSTNYSAVGEGSSCTMRVKRTVSSYSGSMTVSLQSGDPNTVTVPASVTIPSGSSYVDFTVTVKKNETTDDDRIVNITANANSISPAEYGLRITDRTLPDATIPSLAFDADNLYSGCPATLTATVHNDGNLVMYKGKTIKFYYTSSYREPSRYNVATVYTATIDRDLASGESAELTFSNVILPEQVGTYYLYAKVENDGATSQEEFSYSNNMSPLYQVSIKAPFSCTSIETDKQDYIPGEFIHVTGKVEGKLNGQSVVVYANGNSQRSSSTVKIDASGNFEANVLVDRSAYGLMTISAHAIGQTAESQSVNVNVYNMRLTSNSSTTLDCNVDYPVSGVLRLTNLSNKAVNGLKLAESSLPYGMKLELATVPSTLAAGQTAEIAYTVNPTVAYATTEYSPFSITATCTEGVSTQLSFRYICHSTSSNIVFSSPIYPDNYSISKLSTTVGIKSSRIINVKLSNYGLKETGDVQLHLPADCKWAKLLSAETLPSIAPGKDNTIRIQLTGLEDMHSGSTFTTQLFASPAIGAAKMLTINVTVVGTEYSNFAINTEDVYSIVNKDYSKLNGGKVTITNTRTGVVALQGSLDDKGAWTTDKMTQGTYKLEIAAARHRKVTKTFEVGPGEDRSMSLLVPYLAVVTEFEATQDLETNRYKLVSSIDVDYDAPQAIILPALAEDGFTCGKDTVDVVIENVGSHVAYNPELQLANYISGISLKVLNGYPSVLNPGEKYVLRVAYAGPEKGTRRYIGVHNMYYEFTAGSYTLSENDDYQQLLGCYTNEEPSDTSKVLPPVMPVMPETPDDPVIPGTPLPNLNSSASLTFEDVHNLKTDTDIKALLDIHNGSGKEMAKLRFIPVCYDAETDDDLSDLVKCTEGTYEGFSKSGSFYSLADKLEGKLNLSYNFDASLTQNGTRTVLVGGQITYYCNGMTSTQMFPLIEVTLTASGKVQATYLIQHNYMSDDTETADRTEATQPAEVVMLVTNQGAASEATAEDVFITNDDLDVVSNTTFQATPYQSIYADRDSVAGNYDYYNVNLGKLTSEGIHSYHWMNTSDVMAHVKGTAGELGEAVKKSASLSSGNIFSFEVKDVYSLVRSVSDEHNQDMSDMSELCVTDMEYTVKALAKTNAYLLDIQDDEYHTADAVMEEDGTMEELNNVSEKSTVEGGSGTYTLTVKAGKSGWIYGKIDDPTNGVMVLEKVVRNSDNAVVAAANFWQTTRTVTSDYSIINENLLHFADSISDTKETYTLTYTARPDDLLKVVAMKAYTEDGTEVKNGETTSKPVKTVRISFNKAAKNIGAQYALLSVMYGDPAQSKALSIGSSTDVVTCLDTKTRMEWEISLAHADVVAGKHEFTLLTNKVKEYAKPHAYGEGSTTMQWTEDFSQKVQVNLTVASVSPKAVTTAPGSIDLKSGEYSTGKMTVKATPAAGWQFAYWTVNGEEIDGDATLEYDLQEATDLQANFSTENYSLKIVNPENGNIIGNGDGVYEFGAPVNLTVSCAYESCPDYWLINGEKMYSGQWSIAFNMTDDTEVSVVLKKNETTGISEISCSNSSNANVYTISGIKVNSRINAPGLYIVNGKKMVIRK